MAFAIKGRRQGDSVVVSYLINGVSRFLPKYTQEVNHSPDGFQWGYSGSGPTQLSYAVLREYFKYMGYHDQLSKKVTQKYYMAFRDAVFAKITKDEFIVTSCDFNEFFHDKRDDIQQMKVIWEADAHIPHGGSPERWN